jgi:hypothetical protein
MMLQFVADAVMQTLWYPTGMLNAQAAAQNDARDELKKLGKKPGWAGVLPSADWLADQVGLKAMYD